MVKGLSIFKKHFANFQEKYVLIGGTACMLAMEEVGIPFRATKDLDMVLCIEALNKDFVVAFWKFVEAGNYQIQEKSSGKPILYRFYSPKNSDFPAKIELSSRAPQAIELENGYNFSSIPLNESKTSLSAILIDENYYQFILSGKKEVNGISIVGAEHLIPLKAKAWLNLSSEKANGEKVDSKDIRKHKNDIFRLYQLLAMDENISLSLPIKNDMQKFLESIEKEPIDLKTIGLKNTTYGEVLNKLKIIYNIVLSKSLHATSGMWANRNDLPDFEKLRKEFDRF